VVGVELSHGTRTHPQEVFVVHANAPLSERGRLRLARLIVEDGWPVARAAERMQVAWPTAKRWADRYQAEGRAGLADRSSRPRRSPRATPAPVVRRIVALRWRQRLGPVTIAAAVGVAPSTAHQVLRRCRINRLTHLDRVTGEPVRRYEHPTPGDLLHVDVKKLGNIPDGGGWRYVGRVQGKRNRAATPGKPRSVHHNPRMGTAFVHTVLDDHSRVAYAEIHDDETAATATAVLRRAVAWFAARDVTIRRVLSDNGSAYRSHAWRDTCTELGITPKRTRPYRPQTNGKICERFHRTLADGWAFRRLYTGESQRRNALPGWIHEYNHHRPHTAIGGLPPISRLTNLSGQYT
jgi:transposase InsO family protein